MGERFGTTDLLVLQTTMPLRIFIHDYSRNCLALSCPVQGFVQCFLNILTGFRRVRFAYLDISDDVFFFILNYCLQRLKGW